MKSSLLEIHIFLLFLKETQQYKSDIKLELSFILHILLFLTFSQYPFLFIFTKKSSIQIKHVMSKFGSFSHI